MKQNFVTFYSPGTFVSETTKKEIHGWDIAKAVEMSKKIKERHGALPYGFRFSTNEKLEDELDSKETETSNMYYLGGETLTLSEIKARNNDNDRILISNMERNKWDKVIENNNSWKITQPLRDGDVVLSV